MFFHLLNSFRHQINQSICFLQHLDLKLFNLKAVTCFDLSLGNRSDHNTILPDQKLAVR